MKLVSIPLTARVFSSCSSLPSRLPPVGRGDVGQFFPPAFKLSKINCFLYLWLNVSLSFLLSLFLVSSHISSSYPSFVSKAHVRILFSSFHKTGSYPSLVSSPSCTSSLVSLLPPRLLTRTFFIIFSSLSRNLLPDLVPFPVPSSSPPKALSSLSRPLLFPSSFLLSLPCLFQGSSSLSLLRPPKTYVYLYIPSQVPISHISFYTLLNP